MLSKSFLSWENQKSKKEKRFHQLDVFIDTTIRLDEHICVYTIKYWMRISVRPPHPKRGRVKRKKKKLRTKRTKRTARGVLNKSGRRIRERRKTIEASLLLLLLPLIFWFPLLFSFYMSYKRERERERSFCPRFFQFRSGSVVAGPFAAVGLLFPSASTHRPAEASLDSTHSCGGWNRPTVSKFYRLLMTANSCGSPIKERKSDAAAQNVCTDIYGTTHTHTHDIRWWRRWSPFNFDKFHSDDKFIRPETNEPQF